MTALRIPAAMLAVLLVAGCQNDVDEQPRDGSSQARKTPSPERLAACEAKLRKDYKHALEEGDDAESTGRPRECRGVSKPALKRIMMRIIREETPRLDPETGKTDE